MASGFINQHGSGLTLYKYRTFSRAVQKIFIVWLKKDNFTLMGTRYYR